MPADGNGMAVAGFTVTYTGRGVGKFADREEVSEELSFSNYAEAGDRVLYTVEGRYNTEYELLVSAVDRFGNVSNAVAIACTTGDYANEKPRITERFGNIKIAEAGAASSVRFVLSDYFSDPNLADGDVLAYSITNRYEHIVRTTLEEGNVLVLEPLARGTANVTVLATDLDGEVAQSAMTVIIENGPDPSDKPDEPPSRDSRSIPIRWPTCCRSISARRQATAWSLPSTMRRPARLSEAISISTRRAWRNSMSPLWRPASIRLWATANRIRGEGRS